MIPVLTLEATERIFIYANGKLIAMEENGQKFFILLEVTNGI